MKPTISQFLSAAYHEALRGPEGGDGRSGSVMHTIEVDIPGRFQAPRRKDERATFWIEPGLICPKAARWWKVP